MQGKLLNLKMNDALFPNSGIALSTYLLEILELMEKLCLRYFKSFQLVFNVKKNGKLRKHDFYFKNKLTVS